MSKEEPHDVIPHARVIPRIIIHGGAGNITKTTIPRDRYDEYEASLNNILGKAADVLSKPGATALDVATYAVSLLEDDPLYNSGHGAVFTREGKNELECSIMVSNGYKKRGVGCMMLKHIKNPIKLARELLIKGEEEDGGGAKDHCEYSGEFVEGLAKNWGLEIVDQSYFFTQRKWDEHKRGLAEEKRQEELGVSADIMSDWEKNHYIPLGTCGAVVLDSFGMICAATSTGGLTNKVPGRIGDTPTLGAGYWAEEWTALEKVALPKAQMLYQPCPKAVSPINRLSRGEVLGLLNDCLPSLIAATSSAARPTSITRQVPGPKSAAATQVRHAVGYSSSGNGDSFIRLCASRTAAAYSRFTPTSLATATSWMSGPGGELQKSAGDRWGKVHEGTGGMIGIELVGRKAEVVCDYNCGGMFRAWTDDEGQKKCLIFRTPGWESGPENWDALC